MRWVKGKLTGDKPSGKDPDHPNVEPTLVVAETVSCLHVGVHIGILLASAAGVIGRICGLGYVGTWSEER